MPHLNDEHISYIRRDLHYRGIVLEGIEEELLDHICSRVEEEMENGERFFTAYHKTLRAFGKGQGLRQIQRLTVLNQRTHTHMMLGHYITIALRHFRKHALFTFINVAGLAMGVAACFMIFLLIVNEVSYDRYHEKAERIFRLTNETMYNGNFTRSVTVPAAATKALVSDFPEVEAAVHSSGQGIFFTKRAEGMDNIPLNRVTFVGNDFFRIFSVPFVAGDPSTALLQPNTIVLNESSAHALFGNEDPMNKPLILDNHMHVTVTGVYRDFPERSHVQFNALVSEAGTEYEKIVDWMNENLESKFPTKAYVLLREGSDPEAFKEKLKSLVPKYIAPSVGVLGKTYSNDNGDQIANNVSFGIQPLKDVHLDAGYLGDFEPAFDITYIYVLFATGIFILGIASINFVNLSTARSSNRAKEVGMRKVMGSLRGYLVRQFLIESIVLSSLAVMIAIGLAWILLPAFNSIAGKQLQFPWTEPVFYLLTIGASLILGVLAGLYPSIYLSSFKPAQVLKGSISLGIRGGSVRSALVVSQFAISIFLVIGTIVLFRQVDFINSKNLGFEREQVILVQETYLLGNQKGAYKDEALRNTIFTSASISGFLPAAGPWRLPRSWWRDGNKEASTITAQDWAIDAQYFETLGMKIKSGRNFLDNTAADSSAVVVNETTLKALGLTEDVIGQNLGTYRAMGPAEYRADEYNTFTIVGVVEDFHFESMKQAITPVIFRLSDRPRGSIIFRFEAGKADEAIAVLRDQWKKMAPSEPFSYDFVAEGFTRVYASEKRLSEIFGMFTTVALVIACLGLFALITFTTEQRKKEVGIRKVMGASVPDIVILFSKELGKLIVIAFVLAAPVAWYTVEWWLESYNYRVDVGMTVYLIAGVLAIGVAWLTTSVQSIRSATANPADALRGE
jgi:putative ABC transport system permease protein